MTKKWTGNLVGLMHDNRITFQQLAVHMNLSYQYVSMVLNERRTPPGAEERFTKAVLELTAEGDKDSLPNEPISANSNGGA